MNNNGFVSFIGAGPGDIGLIPAKAISRLENADIILYDRLVNPLLLEYCHEHAELIYCGKLPDRHLLRQEVINDLILEHAINGKTVVRLKGGDPGVFGRVGEEIVALEQNQIMYEIIPGITSGIAAPLYAGIPVTHRDISTSFAIVTAHNRHGSSTINWQALAEGVDTIAFYMGIKNLNEITHNLMKFGREPDEPVKIIQWGTLNKQRTLTTTLANAVEQVKEEGISNPAITLVGQVAGLDQGIKSWFERSPLFGKHILLARSTAQPGKIGSQLRDLGAEVFQYPRWSTKEEPFPENLHPNNYSQISFETKDSVQWFFNWIHRLNVDVRHIKASIVSLTKSAEQALIEKGLQEDPSNQDTNVSTLLLGTHPPELERASLTFQSTHTLKPFRQSNQTLKRMLEENRVDYIVFPNARAVSTVVEGLKEIDITPLELSHEVSVVCFGKMSLQAATKCGFTVTHTLEHPETDLFIQWLTSQNKEVHK
ncbi:uroporphyrinogen-III C-methyltransferase [Alkalicoccobacillus porphyridii]|uniref:Uroporphyrinogen-III C-methyltransferase n=1 Tax=Alkalicoccobacillus porphyridii TaxID=2597270 RepID=A0A553ZYY6_9BACI|nr:uroporphyrinogen-III C-methyltransferase [Alkalicoccobacillus porphyridii]TSB46663.1 uroporphyrinogen-III C-methyltransferase [Alkalicoccobacillus porphyridii]